MRSVTECSARTDGFVPCTDFLKNVLQLPVNAISHSFVRWLTDNADKKLRERASKD
ncbi:hypothetical protein C8R27_1065 [Nitrosomonas ureae]|nr:hypothetical protein C8R27_1065 [Nitrosomonas ureae]